MPRRRRYHSSIPKVTLPKPIVMMAPKLDLDGLKTAHEWLVVDKLMGFRMAFQWYGQNIMGLLFGDPLNAERQHAYDRAVKAKTLGDGAGTEPEQWHAWTTAMHLYEQKVWPAKSLPKIDEALANTTVSKHIENVQTVLGALNGAYGQFDFRFGATMNPDREVIGKEVLIPQAELDQMIGHPPLQTVLGEAVTIARAMAVVTVSDENGIPVLALDGGIFMSALPQVMSSINAWATNGGKITQAVGKAPKPFAPVVPGTRPVAGQRAPSVKADLSKIIHVVDLSLVHAKGKRSTAIDLLATTDDATVREYRNLLTNTPGLDSSFLGWAINAAVTCGAITLS